MPQRERRLSGLYSLATAALRRLEPELAHELTLRGLEMGFGPTAPPPPASLASTAFGLQFPSPIGLAAGFDKDARVPDAMLRTGFGFVEVGTVTPKPQSGNQRPRLFRLPEDRAVINRMGFNGAGLFAARSRLGSRSRKGIVAANVGPNKDAADPIADFVAGIVALAPLADFLVLNVSSPNTPGLRGLQQRSRIDELLQRAVAARDAASPKTPLVLKVAPDLDEYDLTPIVESAISRGIAGLIVGNTSIGLREELRSPNRHQPGGLSGAPLLGLSTRLLAIAHRLAAGRLVLIGCGGVSSGADAYAKIRAGAHLVELYTAMVYAGPELVPQIHIDLAALLARDGFKSVADAVGTGT